jgi:tRNA A64-2'-O-ribosylphosphate transferase
MTEGLDASDASDEEEAINTSSTSTNSELSMARSATHQIHLSSPPQLNGSSTATSKSKFPTSLSDLYTPPPDLNPNLSLYKTLNQLHHTTLSPLPRLRSILQDSHFIARLHHHTSLPLIANERCGSWYIPPHLKSGSAYFKSTDGHVGQWAFSLRRLNLELLKVLGREGGAVLVDSTRRGKVMPDALRRTVVIWVAVVNGVLFGDGEWWGRVQTLEGEEGLTGSEVGVIEGRVEGWCGEFRSLGLDLGALREVLGRPVRCIWAVNGEWDFDRASTGQNMWMLARMCLFSRAPVGE